MTEMYEVAITATGEVRDAEGNLISSEPVEATFTVTADELAEMVSVTATGALVEDVQPTKGESE